LINQELNKIIDQCLKGDVKGQQQLYEYTYTSLAVVVSLYTKDNSERDWIFNTGMLKIFDSLAKYKKGTNYLGWARTILVFTSIDHFRKSNLNSSNNIDVEVIEYEANYFDINKAVSNLAIEEIVGYIKKLPKREQAVFNLFAIEGYSHKEIQSALGINQNTSKWLLNKARVKLKELMAHSFKLKFG